MWPFNSELSKLEDTARAARQKGLEKVRSFRCIGEKFRYLGVEMIVIGHGRWVPGFNEIILLPELTANYVDREGRVRSISFDHEELDAVIAENS